MGKVLLLRVSAPVKARGVGTYLRLQCWRARTRGIPVILSSVLKGQYTQADTFYSREGIDTLF